MNLDWFFSTEFWIVVAFHLFIFFMLALDLGVFNRTAHVVRMREALVWSCVWIGLAGVFAVFVWKYWWWWHPEEAHLGSQRGLEFVTGYLVEKSLSVDNLFVFMVIFRYFGVPAQYQHRILYWGILFALIFRATFILLGAVLLTQLEWMTYVFGGLLLYTSYKLLFSGEHELDPGKNPVLRLAKRFLPLVESPDSPRFWVKREGKWHVTPLLLVLLVVESTDVVFAVDSIPAIFAITKNPFIVYTSNIFAILGLRALYFLLSGFLGMFRYLNVGLALVLAFVGVKMILEHPLRPYLDAQGIERQTTIMISLGVIVTILSIAVVASILAKRRDSVESPSEPSATEMGPLPPGAAVEENTGSV